MASRIPFCRARDPIARRGRSGRGERTRPFGPKIRPTGGRFPIANAAGLGATASLARRPAPSCAQPPAGASAAARFGLPQRPHPSWAPARPPRPLFFFEGSSVRPGAFSDPCHWQKLLVVDNICDDAAISHPVLVRGVCQFFQIFGRLFQDVFGALQNAVNVAARNLANLFECFLVHRTFQVMIRTFA